MVAWLSGLQRLRCVTISTKLEHMVAPLLKIRSRPVTKSRVVGLLTSKTINAKKKKWQLTGVTYSARD